VPPYTRGSVSLSHSQTKAKAPYLQDVVVRAEEAAGAQVADHQGRGGAHSSTGHLNVSRRVVLVTTTAQVEVRSGEVEECRAPAGHARHADGAAAGAAPERGRHTPPTINPPIRLGGWRKPHGAKTRYVQVCVRVYVCCCHPRRTATSRLDDWTESTVSSHGAKLKLPCTCGVHANLRSTRMRHRRHLHEPFAKKNMILAKLKVPANGNEHTGKTPPDESALVATFEHTHTRDVSARQLTATQVRAPVSYRIFKPFISFPSCPFLPLTPLPRIGGQLSADAITLGPLPPPLSIPHTRLPHHVPRPISPPRRQLSHPHWPPRHLSRPTVYLSRPQCSPRRLSRALALFGRPATCHAPTAPPATCQSSLATCQPPLAGLCARSDVYATLVQAQVPAQPPRPSVVTVCAQCTCTPPPPVSASTHRSPTDHPPPLSVNCFTPSAASRPLTAPLSVD